mmetsp:Transcript_13007/g.19723  ORF Transcript_13007/g.19723 Transcript_13007/m.19723 type:complete len:212 (+) Transcript_13007:13-648(+)|eukprot:CAMPEP_0194781734 /NCGR_PEP_ID=MMETSP0323_2-20130528/77114_1 /TAXON_ID=2866 ORGANISM="Crypthecodinium cohnii, Strain Seligo" /NCGR_SAMPLE_ID=MMETSP0323_2 /ASSEMBLY_ACC=CAM_ASM_000346 /LENGTH=211 /DNA_ID=CAMNT_0039720301 /DNA_START=28 /DNA_END=663 /DNA_ORIENTATION=+
MAGALRARLLKVGPPVVAAGCFTYTAWCAHEAFFSEGAKLSLQWEADTIQLDQRRLAWVQSVVAALPTAGNNAQAGSAAAAAAAAAAGASPSSSSSSSSPATTIETAVILPEPRDATVIREVHNLKALGSAGIKLAQGETVQVLAEGKGINGGFHVVRNAAGVTGIFPKPYLKSTDESLNVPLPHGDHEESASAPQQAPAPIPPPAQKAAS